MKGLSLYQQHRRQTSIRFLWFFAAHLPFLLTVAWYFNTGLSFAATGWISIFMGPLIANYFLPGNRITALTIALAAMSYSALLIHLGRGMIEMHFHVFVMLAILSSFGDVWVVLLAALAIAVHHLGFFFFLPRSVFN